MDFINAMSQYWTIIWNSGISKFGEVLAMNVPELILYTYGISEVPSTGFIRDLYNTLYDILSIVPVGENMSLSDVSIFSFMFGVGIFGFILYTLFKWVKPI